MAKMSNTAALRLVGKEEGDKQRALEAALTQIDRAFGKGSVMKLGDKGRIVEIESVSTGSLGLDLALGIGGLPKGRVVEIYGPESSGKTTLALHVVAEVQKAGGTAAFVEPNTRWTRPTPTSSASISTTCWWRSRTPANRRWRSSTPWCAPARWTSWSSTRWRR
jgi:hypothetical protein